MLIQVSRSLVARGERRRSSSTRKGHNSELAPTTLARGGPVATPEAIVVKREDLVPEALDDCCDQLTGLEMG